MNSAQFSTLGKSGSQGYTGLEIIELLDSAIQAVTFTSDEVAAVCPVTGQPDWYVVSIDLIVDKCSIESKSLKLYLQSFRNEGIFCEALASKICRDVFAAATPYKCSVSVTQKSRGGVTLFAVARETKDHEFGEGYVKAY